MATSLGLTQRYSDLGVQLAAVEAGLGVAALPCFAADARATLVRLFPPEPRRVSLPSPRQRPR